MDQEKLIQDILDASQNMERLPKADYVHIPLTVPVVMEHYNCTEAQANEIIKGMTIIAIIQK